MSRGHFQVEDDVSARRPLGHAEVRRQSDGVRIAFSESALLPPLLTRPEAVAWFEEQVLGRNLLDFGLCGWMADFGEYLPVDVRLASGEEGALAHNAWPVLWARVNVEAVARRGGTGEILFFMRATGLPLQRPLFLHFEDDPQTYGEQTSYLLGADLLVAPVIAAGAGRRRAYLPTGARWRHVWSGEEWQGGSAVEVAARIGRPTVFFRPDSSHAALFAGLAGC